MTKAISDGEQCGMPPEYAEKYIEPYVPKDHESRDIVMIRTTRIDEHSAGVVPRGFASWSRG